MGSLDRGAVVVDADGRPVGFLGLAVVGLRIARRAFPEMGAVEEFEAGAVDVHRLERVDEAEQLRLVRAVELAEFLDEGQHAGADHDVVEDVRVGGDLRQVFGERALGRRDRDLGDDIAALRLDGGREIVAMVVAEGVVGIDHRHLLAEVAGDPRRHRGDLGAHVGDAGLEDVAVQLAGGDVVALADHVVGDLELAGGRCRADDDMAEQGAVDDVGLVLAGELADDFSAALGVGAVVLDDDLDRPAVDAAGLVDELDRRIGGLFVPAAIGGADAGAMRLEADLDRCGRSAPASSARSPARPSGRRPRPGP